MTMLKNQGVTDLVLVVTRYFGGVKLGTGGLVRAYTHAAQLALEKAGIVEMIQHQQVSVKIDYTLLGKIQNFLSNHPDIRVADTLYSDHVILELLVLPERLESFQADMADLTSAQHEWEEGAVVEVACDVKA
jgi:putative IMPACT (imprinted ancient) family translation regulator